MSLDGGDKNLMRLGIILGQDRLHLAGEERSIALSQALRLPQEPRMRQKRRLP